MGGGFIYPGGKTARWPRRGAGGRRTLRARVKARLKGDQRPAEGLRLVCVTAKSTAITHECLAGVYNRDLWCRWRMPVSCDTYHSASRAGIPDPLESKTNARSHLEILNLKLSTTTSQRLRTFLRHLLCPSVICKEHILFFMSWRTWPMAGGPSNTWLMQDLIHL